MGGAKSKFEDTDWVRADGKLTNRTDTIDGSPPTSAYGVYYLTKTKLNQREFEVTDLEQNLLYTTKCVPGTLCWFDVYGSGINDCRLRVQVDLSRRYWLIYRMGIPTFAGQLADREATDKLASDRRAALEDLTATPFLFRKCCITVSWSRYMAVAMQYDAPEIITERMRRRKSEESLEHHGRLRTQESADDKEKKKDDDNDNQNDATTYYSYDATNVHDSSSLLRVSNSSSSLQASNSSINDNINVNSDSTETGPEPASQKVEEQDTNNSTNEETSSSSWWMPKMAQEFQDMVKVNTQAYQDNHKKKLKADPLEGIIHLDKKPILLCQEIYDKLIGNHQTSLLSKDKAIEYLRQDLEDHMNDGGFDGDDPFLADQEGIVAQLEALRRMEEEPAKGTNVDEGGETAAQTDDEKRGNKNGNPDTDEESTDDSNHGAPDADQALLEGGTPTQPLHSLSKANLLNKKNNDDSELDDTSKAPASEENIVDDESDPSLIGYWKWENTWSVHQMKMHLGKGSDLALHVVMAIIVNQVRYERNAIAMTV